MLDPAYTERYSTPNQSALTARPKRGVVLHHSTMTSLDAYIDMVTRARKQVSSDAGIKDGRRAGFIAPGMRAWSLSDPYWDSVLSSCECANESTDGWTISDASHWSIAIWIANLATAEGWWPHRDGDPRTWTVFGHREIYIIFGDSYATACPGGMDLNVVTTRAQLLMKGALTPPEADMSVIYEATTDSRDGLIKKGQCFIQGTEGPLRWLSALEKGSYDYWAKNGIPYRRAPWAGEDIRKLVTMVGLRNLGTQSSLNGTLLIGDPLRTVTPPTDARVSVDVDAIAKALAAALPPGSDPAAIAKAVRSELATDPLK